MMVFSDAVSGLEDDYNDWYSNVHLPEVINTDGFVAAQRFQSTGVGDVPDHQYLAIYEIQGDPEAAAAALYAGTASRTPTSEGLARPVTVWWYSAITDQFLRGQSSVA
jgi:hypothetical protein